jgi:hypothetical protein
VPPDGLKDGVAIVPPIEYAAVARGESVKPALYAIALMVSLVSTLTGAEYAVPTVSVGVLPSVV